jgi:hypothetical protein
MSDDTTHLTVTPEVLARLHDATPESARKRRKGPGGLELTYVDARYVMSLLDVELGPGNWQDEYVIGPGGKVSCRIGIFVEDRGWVWKGDGAGETDIEGEKGSFSDAFKRAAVKWGIARDLYDEKPTTSTGAPPAQRPPQAAAPVQDLHEGYEGGEDENVCPVHGLAWVLKPAGTSKSTGKPYPAFWTCPSTERPYCKAQPSQAWRARHEK